MSPGRGDHQLQPVEDSQKTSYKKKKETFLIFIILFVCYITKSNRYHDMIKRVVWVLCLLLVLVAAAEPPTKTTYHMRPISTCKGHEKSHIPPEKLPLIAIMAASTTRNVKNPGTSNMALFTVLLPSLLRSLDCGYRYVYMLGYDANDAFYDSSDGMNTVRKWFMTTISSVLKENGIELSLHPVRVINDMKKPGEINVMRMFSEM